MPDMRLLCFSRGRPGHWEAICVDLDIAVQGETHNEVIALLEASIRSYLEALADEEPAVRARLLRRRAPWYVRFSLVMGFLWHALTRRDDGDYRASYELPCHA